MSAGSNPQVTMVANLGGNFADEAERNARSADEMAEALEGDLEALKELQAQLRNLRGTSLAGSDAAKQLRAQIAAQREAVAANQVALLRQNVRLSEWRKNQRDAAKESKKDLTAQRDELKAFGDQVSSSSTALGSLVQRTRSLSSAIGKGGLAGAIGLVVVALAAVVAGAGAATAALAAYALRVQDARRAEMLRLEGLTKMPNYWGIQAGKASDLQAAIDAVSGAVALNRDQIERQATSLYRAGLRGRNLSAALEGSAIRAAVLGEEMGAAFASMAVGAALTGQSVTALAARVKSQLGGVAERQLLSVDVQLRKLRSNLDALFRDVKIEGFLGGLKDMLSIFSQTTVTGRALKSLVTSLLNPLFGQARDGMPIVKRLFLGMVIGALEVSIAVQKLRIWWLRTTKDIKTNVDWATEAVHMGRGAVMGLVVGVVALTAAVGALAVGAAVMYGTLLAPIVLLGLGIWGAWKGISALVGGARKVIAIVSQMSWSDIGNAIVRGILDPLNGMWEKGQKLGQEMVKGFKQAWEIRSPSAVARRLVKKDIADGAEAGAKEAGARAGRSVGEMLYPRGGSGGGGGVRGGAGVPLIGSLTIPVTVAGGKGEPEDLAAAVGKEVIKVLEHLAVELGIDLSGSPQVVTR